MKRITVIILALMMALAMVPTVALAEDETITITTSQQLADAIKDQANGQIWNLAADTNFVLDDAMVASYAGISINELGFSGSGFVFPIVVNNLTINGGPNTVVTSSYVATSGNWDKQNFMTIAGDNVTLDGLTLIPNKSQFEIGDGNPSAVNKLIEVIGTGSVIKNLVAKPNTAAGDGSFSGSIFYSNDSLNSTDILENVTLTIGRVSLGNKVNGSLKMTNVTIDFVDALPILPNFLGLDISPATATGVVFDFTNVMVKTNQHRIDLYNARDNMPAIGQVVGGETDVTAGVDPSYIIVIPAAVDFGSLVKGSGLVERDFNVVAQNVVLEPEASVKVSVTSPFAMNNQNGAGGIELAYTLSNSEESLASGDLFATFTADRTEDGTIAVNTDIIQSAGTYKGTMVFTVSYQE